MFQCLAEVRRLHPIIHNITNYVAMPFNANALLAIGASPIMAHAHEEITNLIKISQALVINIGTLDPYWLKSMSLAMECAAAQSIPIIVDPVGAGATRFRTQSVLSLLNSVAPQVIRGNASEIIALVGSTDLKSKGVDSAATPEQAYPAGQELAERYGCTVVISGAQDFIINYEKTLMIENGVPSMTQVTGMGCTASALVAACCAVQSDYFVAATAAMAIMGVAGELAWPSSQGPGSFQVQFLDRLFHLQEAEFLSHLKLNQIR